MAQSPPKSFIKLEDTFKLQHSTPGSPKFMSFSNKKYTHSTPIVSKVLSHFSINFPFIHEPVKLNKLPASKMQWWNTYKIDLYSKMEQ